MEVETHAGVYTTPQEDSYSVNFVSDALSHAYPGCTGVYLGMTGHMLAFYGKKTNPRAGLPHDQAALPVKQSLIFPLGWDTLLDGGCDA